MGVTCYLLLSSLGLAITVQAQSCSRPVAGPNMALKGSDIGLDTFPDGKTVSFACDVGYVSAGGSTSITCTAGTWSPVRLRCERRNCGAFDEVDNGQIHYPEDTQFGSKIVITCNEGFILIGKREITCGAEGWMDRKPTCDEITCEAPGAIKNGTFSPQKDNYGYAEIVQYSCKGSLALIGQSTLTCSETGAFQPEPPTCRSVQCADPIISHAEWVSGSRPPHKFKATVTYKCISGHVMTGQSTMICESDGQWSPGYPTCTGVCKRPHVDNGDIVDNPEDPYKFGSTVTFKCNDGYKMKGEEKQTCEKNGDWSPGLPKCESDHIIIIICCVVILLIILAVSGAVYVARMKKQKRVKGGAPENTTTDPEKVELQKA